MIRFFLEGSGDVKFIKDLILHFFGIQLENINFINTNGYNSQWIHLNAPNFRRAIVEGFSPIIILDADDDFEARTTEISNSLLSEGLAIPFFLIPNNANNGNLETLLLKIVNPEHSGVLNCFEDYKVCIQEYYQPDDKSKVFAYLDAMYSTQNKEKVQYAKRDFRDADVWDIENVVLDPLKIFLQQHFE